MKRLFTFGCSFTQYFYPTWADILIQEYRNLGYEGYNYGRCGAGNQYIFTKLIEANIKYKFNENDIVIVQWSSVAREDRFKNGDWVTSGNIFSQDVIPKDFVDEWGDPDHYLIRDLAIVSSTKLAMESTNCKFINFTMNDFYPRDYYVDKSSFQNKQSILEFYSDDIKMDAPNMMDYAVLKDTIRPIVYVSNFGNRETTIEHHPTPLEHFIYLKKYILPLLSIELSFDTISYLNEWNDKINNKETQPIDLDSLGLKYNNRDSDFFIV